MAASGNRGGGLGGPTTTWRPTASCGVLQGCRVSELAVKMLEAFRGREDHVAVGDDTAFHPHHVPNGIQPSWLDKRHLNGTRCLGFYVMTAESQCWTTCVDFDCHADQPDDAWLEKTEKVYFELTGAGLSPLVEFSQSGKGAHVWLFFREPVDGWLVRAWWRGLGERMEMRFREVNPKQERLSGKGLGNLVRYPLWNESRFVDPENEWATIEPVTALKSVERRDAGDYKLLAFELGMSDLRPETSYSRASTGPSGTGDGEPRTSTHTDQDTLSPRVKALVKADWSLLARRWRGDTEGMNDPSPSAIALSIATELVRLYVPTPEIETAIRCWCREHERERHAERPQWVAATVRKAYDFVIHRVEMKTAASATTFQDAAHGYLDLLERGDMRHIGSGIGELDDSIEGIAKGEVCVVAARPGHGKSAFAFQWVDSAALRGVPCLVISEEMSRNEVGKRRLLSISVAEQDHWPHIVPALRTHVDRYYDDREPVYLVENANSIDRVEELMDQYCRIHNVGLVAIDYLQLLRGGRDKSRYEDVTDISRRIKQATARNGCSTLLLCQLNREIEKRTGNEFEPKLSDLRDSGGIEQDADLVLFLVWSFRINAKQYADDQVAYTIWASKRRNGAIKNPRVYTRFDASRQRIGERIDG